MSNKLLMPIILLLSSILSLTPQKGYSQQKSFIGVGVGLDIANAAPEIHAEVQRIILSDNKGSWNLYLQYSRQKNDVICLFCYGPDYILEQWKLIGGRNFLTNGKADGNGFFLHAGMGAGHVTLTDIDTHFKSRLISPVIEAGFGIIFPLSNKLKFQWKNTGGMSTGNFKLYSIPLPAYLQTKLLIGF